MVLKTDLSLEHTMVVVDEMVEFHLIYQFTIYHVISQSTITSHPIQPPMRSHSIFEQPQENMKLNMMMVDCETDN